MPKIKFNSNTLKKILLTLDTKKATGPDGIPAIVLKTCAEELAPLLQNLFQLSLEKGIFPDNWKSALIQPIPKKGKKNDPTNYRPIAILPDFAIAAPLLICSHMYHMSGVKLRRDMVNLS